MIKISAVFEKVIVETLKEMESVSTGGILLPTSIVTMPQSYGKVVSVGPESVDKGINEGDIIIFHKHGGQVMLLDNVEYRTLLPGEIYGTYSPV